MKKKICYLCGKRIVGRISKDHLPPFQFFPENYRKDHDLSNLITLPTHPKCNFAYQKDEDYFVVSLTPAIKDNYLNFGVFERLKRMSKRDQGRRLLNQVLGEFKKNIGNIYLPSHLAAKNVDSIRFRNIVWKLTRGVYFHEYCEVLPHSTEHTIFKIYQNVEEIPNEAAEIFRLSPEPFKGIHPRILEYKIVTLANMNLWLLIFWQSFGALVFFHIDGCQCTECLKKANKIG
ncbi:hypothetical protein ACFL5L_01925 [candidate division KSB1 bacterium]